MNKIKDVEVLLQHLDIPNNKYGRVEMFVKVKGERVAYRQIDQEYYSDPSGGVKSLWNL